MSFWSFCKREGCQILPIKKEEFLKWEEGGGGEGCSKKGRYHIFSYKLTLYSAIVLSVWCVPMFCVFTAFPTVLFVFHGRNLLLSNLINRYMASASELLFRSKSCVKIEFYIRGRRMGKIWKQGWGGRGEERWARQNRAVFIK